MWCYYAGVIAHADAATLYRGLLERVTHRQRLHSKVEHEQERAATLVEHERERVGLPPRIDAVPALPPLLNAAAKKISQ